MLLHGIMEYHHLYFLGMPTCRKKTSVYTENIQETRRIFCGIYIIIGWKVYQ